MTDAKDVKDEVSKQKRPRDRSSSYPGLRLSEAVSAVEKIKKAGANVVFCQKGIDDIAQYYLTKGGIYACRRIAKSDMDKLAKATGGKIISNLNELTGKELGKAAEVSEEKEGEEALKNARAKDCKNNPHDFC